jgi:neutral trehalase
MASTEFSAYAALEMEYLSQFHEILGNVTGARYWAARSNATAEAVHRLLWDAEDKFYYYKSTTNNTFVKVPTTCGFAPLLLAGVSDDRVAALVAHLNDPNKFASVAPIPTVAKVSGVPVQTLCIVS